MNVNGKRVEVPEAWREASLLEFLRDCLGLTGTKFGCGIGACGACTVHLDGAAVRACVVPVEAVGGGRIRTIEGLADERGLHPVQLAWEAERVPQCGYCQPGQIMTAAAFLEQNPEPSEAQVAEAMNENLCRCGTYPRIRRGVLRAAALARQAVRS